MCENALVKISEKNEDGNGNLDKENSEPWIVDSAGVVHPRESQSPHVQNGVSLTTSRRPKRRLIPTGLGNIILFISLFLYFGLMKYKSS